MTTKTTKPDPFSTINALDQSMIYIVNEFGLMVWIFDVVNMSLVLFILISLYTICRSLIEVRPQQLTTDITHFK